MIFGRDEAAGNRWGTRLSGARSTGWPEQLQSSRRWRSRERCEITGTSRSMRSVGCSWCGAGVFQAPNAEDVGAFGFGQAAPDSVGFAGCQCPGRALVDDGAGLAVGGGHRVPFGLRWGSLAVAGVRLPGTDECDAQRNGRDRERDAPARSGCGRAGAWRWSRRAVREGLFQFGEDFGGDAVDVEPVSLVQGG